MVSTARRAAAWWLLATAPVAGAYTCRSDLDLGPARAIAQKGLALDDTTFWNCSHQIPERWPNTRDRVTSLRLFKAWDPRWPEEDKEGVWQNILGFVQANGAKLLVGTQITCRERDDLRAWNWTKQFVRLLGPRHIMGLAIGNEMELLFTKQGVDASVTPECLAQIWQGGYFWQQFVHRVAEFDTLGFGQTAVTSVFGGLALATSIKGLPFFEDPRAMVNSFLFNATQKYSSRFTFTFNFYPYFDPNLHLDPDTKDQCTESLRKGRCFNASECSVPASAHRARRKMRDLTGRAESTLWVGETGWSSPQSRSLATSMAFCKAWSDTETFRSFYEGFLHWDLAGPKGVLPDHVFYFTARDSVNFGVGEHFGLIETCSDLQCKLRSKDRGASAAVAARGAPTPSTTGGASARLTLPYDCVTGVSGWERWSPGKKAWCCIHHGLKCPMPTSKAIRPAATTPAPASAVFHECMSKLPIEDWSARQRDWCCKHQNLGCEETTTQLPSTGAEAYDCHDGLPLLFWGAKQKSWCCSRQGIGCSVIPTSFPYDCTVGYSNWRTGWSLMKKAWCCPHDGHGCQIAPTPRTPFLGDCTDARGCELKATPSTTARATAPATTPAPTSTTATRTTTRLAAPEFYNCTANSSDPESGWGELKREWCCRHRRRGCHRKVADMGEKFDQRHHERRVRPEAASTSPHARARPEPTASPSLQRLGQAARIVVVFAVSWCVAVALRCYWVASVEPRTRAAQPYEHLRTEELDVPLNAAE